MSHVCAVRCVVNGRRPKNNIGVIVRLGLSNIASNGLGIVAVIFGERCSILRGG